MRKKDRLLAVCGFIAVTLIANDAWAQAATRPNPNVDSALQAEREMELISKAGHAASKDVENLLALGVNPNATDGEGYTPLVMAALGENPDVVSVLAKHGADVNAGSAKKGGMTALMFAAGAGKVKAAQALIKAGADVNRQADIGLTALMFAAVKDGAQVIPVLVKAGADVNRVNTKGTPGTALMYAAQAGKAQSAKALIEAGADVNYKTSDGYTALKVAAEEGHPNVVELLKKAGAKE